MARSERLAYLDSMRGILMLLGVVLHSAQVFNPDSTWIINSDSSTRIAGWLVDGIHFFRLPAFFMVSGFFFLISLRKHGGATFLKLRGERILIPLLVSALTLNSLQALLLDRTGWRPFEADHYFFGAEWLSHLWFLYYLFGYCLVACLAIQGKALVPESIGAWCRLFLEKCHVLVTLCLLSLCQIALLALGKLLPLIYDSFFGINPFDVIFYLQFFLCGALLCQSKSFLAKFVGLSPLCSIPLLLSTALALNLFVNQQGVLYLVAYKYLYILAIWLSCSLCFSLFKRFGDRTSPVFSFCADASYSIYLFHHLLVLVLGMLLIQWGVGGLTGLLLLAATVMAICSLLHLYLIARSDLLTYLFNGTRRSPERKTLPVSLEQA